MTTLYMAMTQKKMKGLIIFSPHEFMNLVFLEASIIVNLKSKILLNFVGISGLA